MFSHMLQVYVLNVSSASDLCRIQVFHVASVSEVYSESYGAWPGHWGKGRGEPRAGRWGVMHA
jgi:hypothetical protein